MFKVGDKVRLIVPAYTYKKDDVFTVVEGEVIANTPRFWIHEGMCTLYINEPEVSCLFELVQEGQPTKHLKQNWSIRVHSKEQAEVYEKTLIALGYALTSNREKDWTNGTNTLVHGYKQSQNYFWYSEVKVWSDTENFDNLESFLAWHFQEEETEQQSKSKSAESN